MRRLICDMIKGNESDDTNIDLELQARKVTNIKFYIV